MRRFQSLKGDTQSLPFAGASPFRACKVGAYFYHRYVSYCCPRLSSPPRSLRRPIPWVCAAESSRAARRCRCRRPRAAATCTAQSVRGKSPSARRTSRTTLRLLSDSTHGPAPTSTPSRTCSPALRRVRLTQTRSPDSDPLCVRRSQDTARSTNKIPRGAATNRQSGSCRAAQRARVRHRRSTRATRLCSQRRAWTPALVASRHMCRAPPPLDEDLIWLAMGHKVRYQQPVFDRRKRHSPACRSPLRAVFIRTASPVERDENTYVRLVCPASHPSP